MISVIIPTIDEESSIGQVIDRVIAVMRTLNEPYEIVIVDTASRDRTVEIALSKGCRVINEPMRGYGRAYKTGIENCRGDTIVTLDADASYPPEAIPKLFSVFREEELEFLTASRFEMMTKGAMSRTHRFGNLVLNITTRFLFGVDIKDSQSGMWIMRKNAYEKLAVRSDGFSFSEEIKIKAAMKLRFGEYPVEYSVRSGKKKLSTWKDGWNNLKFLFNLKFQKDKSGKQDVAA